MRSEQMRASYARVEHNGQVTPADFLLLIKDYDARLHELEKNCCENMERTTPDRSKDSRVSKRKVSKS